MRDQVIKEENRKNERIIGQVLASNINNLGLLALHGRFLVPKSSEARHTLMEEAYKSRFLINSGATNMYKDLRHGYWWPCMKKNVSRYVERCLICQKTQD